mgnify:CR=1 FL=1
MYNTKDLIRDLFLFTVLALLIIHASDRLKTFLSLHKNSFIHELDRGFADQLYIVQKQVRTMLQYIEQGTIADTNLDRISWYPFFGAYWNNIYCS